MFPLVTVVLIVINIIVYYGVERAGVFSEPTNENAIVELSFIPYELSHPDQECAEVGGQIGCGTKPALIENGAKDVEQPSVYVTIFTAMFMHGGFMHLAGNMLFLWIFGDNLEDLIGHVRYAVFYILCGIAAALGQILMGPDSIIPMLGASGAISGVLGGYILEFP